MSKKSIKLLELIKEFNLVSEYLPEKAENILISTNKLNRPGLFLSGFFEYFSSFKIQIIGNVEVLFLKKLSKEIRAERFLKLCEKKVPLIVFTADNEVFLELLDAAKKFKIPILKTSEETSNFMANFVGFLNFRLGPKVGMHGVFVEVFGEGVLILGDSGVGKSETAMELIKKGHRLVADDAVEIIKISNKTLIGSAPLNIRFFMELRGIGIVNVKELFGVKSVKIKKKVDLVVKLKQAECCKLEDERALQNNYYEILGVKLPIYEIIIKPGRNLATIVEVAAIDNRQKKMGYDAATDLFSRLD